MKKSLVLLLALITTASSISFAAKYTVNTSGTVKNSSGKIITSPANSVNQRFYVPAGVGGNVFSYPVIDNFNNNAIQTAPGNNSYTNSVQNNVLNNNYLPADITNQSVNQLFSNYQAQNYVSNNQVNSEPVSIIEFVMDYSGSMSNWIETAKRSMSAILAQIPSSTKVGFRVFGHDYNGSNPTTLNTVRDVKKIIKSGNKFKIVTERNCLGSTSGVCSATQQVAPIVPININNLISGMDSVRLGGATPLVYSLDRTVNQDFASFDRITPKKIVLITDGGENCGGDPCAFAKQLMKKRSDVHIDVVLVSSNSKALSCLSSTTGGHFYNINDLADFSTVINQSMQAQPTIQPQKQDQKYEYIN